MSEIKTPITYGEASILIDMTIAGGEYDYQRLVEAVMAVDVASREQERERCAQLAEDAREKWDSKSLAVMQPDQFFACDEIVKAIRNPEAIPRERPGVLEEKS